MSRFAHPRRRASGPSASAARALRACGRALAWLHLALFLGYAALAAGTMAQRTADGIAVVLCTGEGTVTVTLDQNGNPVDAAHDPCAWAAAGAPATLQPPVLLAAPARARALRAAPAPTGALIASAVRRAHPPRAPPRRL